MAYGERGGRGGESVYSPTWSHGLLQLENTRPLDCRLLSRPRTLASDSVLPPSFTPKSDIGDPKSTQTIIVTQNGALNQKLIQEYYSVTYCDSVEET